MRDMAYFQNSLFLLHFSFFFLFVLFFFFFAGGGYVVNVFWSSDFLLGLDLFYFLNDR